jgi:hypothetical protein
MLGKRQAMAEKLLNASGITTLTGGHLVYRAGWQIVNSLYDDVLNRSVYSVFAATS